MKIGISRDSGVYHTPAISRVYITFPRATAPNFEGLFITKRTEQASRLFAVKCTSWSPKAMDFQNFLLPMLEICKFFFLASEGAPRNSVVR
jgi:hypothetical protein